MSPFNENGKIWMNGDLVPWKDANIHIASHVIHYGSSIFEGFRTYESSQGSVIFRLQAHTRRLYNSCKIYRMKIPYTQEEFNLAVIDTIKLNGLSSCYIRPIVYRGYGTLGVDPFPNPVNCAILVWEWGSYLGAEALEKGVDVKISTWQRMAPNTLPALSKAAANYMNSQLIKMEALTEGYVEGIALNTNGTVSEGSGENIFVVMNGIIHTPPLSSSILPGITRDSVIQLAREKGFSVVEEVIPREMLYIADEVLFTGSAAEITPIRSVDKIIIGSGKRGPITKILQDAFFSYIKGDREDKFNWLTL
ncbi:MAG: branched-chain amino acid transaminase, partial [Candidatus Aminicenantes bacterium]|nr:branched-chain amino acid transaminase [Candidatus Aminicenantes bacterium]